MPKSSTPSFICEFALEESSSGGFGMIDKVEDHARRLYNALLGEYVRRVRAMKSSPDWKTARTIKKGSQARSDAFEAARLLRDLTPGHMQAYASVLRKGSKDFELFIGSHVAQQIATRAWQAVEKLLFGKAKRVRFKRKGEFFSFEGKDNLQILRLLGVEEGSPYVVLHQQRFRLKFDSENNHHVHALGSRVKYVRIIKRRIGEETRYFAQGILEGLPYNDQVKQAKARLRVQKLLGKEVFKKAENIPIDMREVIAYDVGPKHIAVSTPIHSFKRPLAPGIKNKATESRRTQRAMNRSRRANNPNNFNENGTAKKGKREWVKSNNYLHLQRRLGDTKRRQAEQRKTEHGTLANEMLTLGTTIKTEAISAVALQKRYGKSVGIHAPGSFKAMLSRKAANARGRVEDVNTYQTCLSQMCLCGARKKKPLRQREHKCSECGLGINAKIDRDEFSAFLALYTHNVETGNKRKKKVTSRLVLEDARRDASGHLNLPLVAPSVTHNQDQTDTAHAKSGVRRANRKERNPRGLGQKEREDCPRTTSASKRTGKRAIPEFQESPASKVERP